MVTNVSVAPSEPALPQHKLLIGTIQLNEAGCTKAKKEVFVSRCKVWKLKEPEIRQTYETKVKERLANSGTGDGDVEMMWSGLKECWLEVASEVCGKTRGKQRHSETWWWNAEVAELVKRKRQLFQTYGRSKRGKDRVKMEQDKSKYEAAKHATRKGIAKAQEAEQRKFGEKLDEEDSKGTLFRVAKQIVRKNREVVGGGCVKDTDGRMVVEDDEMMEVWRSHYEKLSNEEFPWNREALPVVDAISGPCEEFSIAEVQAAIKKMKNNKAAGPSGIAADIC